MAFSGFLLLWHYASFCCDTTPGQVNAWSIVLQIHGVITAASIAWLALIYRNGNGSPDGLSK